MRRPFADATRAPRYLPKHLDALQTTDVSVTVPPDSLRREAATAEGAWHSPNITWRLVPLAEPPLSH